MMTPEYYITREFDGMQIKFRVSAEEIEALYDALMNDTMAAVAEELRNNPREPHAPNTVEVTYK